MAVVTTSIVAGWIAYEGFTTEPVIPVQGDVPTIGHGATHYEDGTRVRMGDPPITRQRAYTLAVGMLDKTYAECVRQRLGATLINETEFRLHVDFAGQYGCQAYQTGSLARETVAGSYVKACEVFLLYKFMTANKRLGSGWVQTGPNKWRYDCSQMANGQPNKVCWGVWDRSKKRYDACMGAQ